MRIVAGERADCRMIEEKKEKKKEGKEQEGQQQFLFTVIQSQQSQVTFVPFDVIDNIKPYHTIK